MKLNTVALDFGNYELKVCDGGDRALAIRSIHRKLPKGVHALKGYKNSPLVETENTRFHFGHQAGKYSTHEKTVVADKALLARLHLYACLDAPEGRYRLIVSHHSPEVVADGLRKVLVGKHQYRRNGQDCSFEVKQVEVVPEGMGAYWAAKQAGFTPTTGHTIVIDIGGGSWLYRVVASDGEIIAQSVSDRLGSYALAAQIAMDDRLKTPLRRYNLTSADVGVVLDGFAQGHVYAETGISWKDWLGEYLDPWFQGIFAQIRADCASYLPFTRRFVVTGGGAHLVAHKVRGNDAFVVMPDPNFANVTGMWDKFAAPTQLEIVA